MGTNDRFDDSLQNGGTHIRWVRDLGNKRCIADGPRLLGTGIEEAMEESSCYLQFTITETGYKPGAGHDEGTVFVESVEYIPESDDRIPEWEGSQNHNPEGGTSQGAFERSDGIQQDATRKKQ